MPFSDIYEHDATKERLRDFMSHDRVPGTLLLHGPWGIGKARLALTFARALNCERETLDACDECSSCRKAAKFLHPDIRFLFPMPRGKSPADEEKTETATLQSLVTDQFHVIQFEKNATIWMEKVRELRRMSAMSAAEGRKKVFILRDADKMTEDRAGILLKILEEPPRDTHFILTSSRPQALLSTIVSRCQSLAMNELSRDTIASILIEEKELSTADARLSAALAQGSLARALLSADEDVRALRDQALELLIASERGGVALHEAAAELSGARDRDLMRRLAHTLALWHSDLLGVRYGLGDERIANIDKKQELERQASRIDVDEIERRLHLFEGLRISMERNVGYATAAYWLMASLNDPEAARETVLGPRLT